MPQTYIIQGRRIGQVEIAEIQNLIQGHPQWSRWRLSRVLAQRWQWYSAAGQLKDMAARTLLLKLQQRQWIELPQRRRVPVRRVPHWPSEGLETPPAQPLEGKLSELLLYKSAWSDPSIPIIASSNGICSSIII